MVYAIETLARQLKIDFGRLYSSRFATDQEIKDWKNRLWTKAKGLHPQDMLDGYESIVDTKLGKLPEIPEIVSATLQFQKLRKADEKNKLEASLAAIKQAPEISESIARKNLAKIHELISVAFGGIDETESQQKKNERLERLREKIALHEKLLKNDFPLLGKEMIAQPSHECSVGWCRKFGTISRAITGNGNFYCSEHYVRS